MHEVIPLVAVSMPFSHEGYVFCVWVLLPLSLHDDETPLDVSSHMLVGTCEREGFFLSVNYNVEPQCNDM